MPLPVLSNNKLLLAAKLFGAAIIVFIGIRQLRGTSLDLVSNFRSVPSPSGIPRKIWQTWHTPAALLADGDRSRVGSWHRVNPDYRYELITDEAAESFVRHHFAQDALLRKTFLGLNDTILKADFLRYLIVLAEGGVYADLDVECYQSIDTWLPLKLQEKAGGIVGIEADRKPVENDIKLYSDYRDHIWGINNWAFLAKRGHPFMRLVAGTVARNLQAVAKEQDCELSGIELSYKQVIDTTGPGAFSAAFLEYASRITGTAFKPADAMMLEEPKMVGDIVVLPIRAMSTAEADRPDGDGARSKDWLSVLFHWSVEADIDFDFLVLEALQVHFNFKQPSFYSAQPCYTKITLFAHIDPKNPDLDSMITNQTALLKAPKVGRSRQNRGAAKHTYFDTDFKDINQKPTSAIQNTSETDHAGEWELPKATKRRQAKQALRKRKSLFEQWHDTHTERLGYQELKSCPQCPHRCETLR